MRVSTFCLCLGVVAAFGCESASASESSTAQGGRVDGASAKRLVAEGATLLDVRSAGEFSGGHVPGAVNVPVDQLAARVGELDKSKAVVTYCAVGARSAQAAALLRDKGFVVHDLGSRRAWPSN